MRKNIYQAMLWLVCLFFAATGLTAQRKVEQLGRGVVALNNGGGSVYVSWRFLATDPESIGFNVYRSIGGAAAVKLNASPITATTDYSDNSASTMATNAYFVKPVINGVEGAASKPFTIQGSTSAKHYQGVVLKETSYSTFVQHVYPGDLDGDGEYDYVVKRKPADAANNVLLEAYTHNGYFMWRIDLGRNMEQGASTHNPFVVVYDFNGDGKAEVFTRTGELTVFADGTTITDADGGNGDGITDYRTLPPVSDMGYMLLADNCPEFVSMVDGMTGKELARREWIDRGAKLTWETLWGDGYGHRMNMNFIGVAFLDGIHPSIVTSRGDGGVMDIEAYDFDGSNINSRWTWSARTNTAKPEGQTWKQFHTNCLNGTAIRAGIPSGYHWADFHNIRIADLDGDGKDEISWGVNAMDDNGKPLYFAKNDVGHGDRFVITDLDPDRPGLECYAIQQAASALAVLYDAKNGERIKTWTAVPSFDVGRGDAADIDPNVKGCELWSYAHSSTMTCKGEPVPGSTGYPAPAQSIWWDADLQREILSGADGNGYNPIINNWNYSTNTTDRLLSLYSEGGAYSNKFPYGSRPALYGDVIGDWREEIFCMNGDSTEMRIFSTWTPAMNRIYCLMQNPEYRTCANIKGYMTTTAVDFYLGQGMTRPPMPPILSSKTLWKGGSNGNAWDVNTTANWLNNDVAKTFAQGDTVLFDLSCGANNTVNLSVDVQPSAVWVSSPIDYTFSGTGAITGTGVLLKTGSGALILANNNTYSGKTTVDQGALVVNGSLTQSPVWLNRQATLGGTGTLGQAVTFEAGAIVSPATSGAAGTLTFAQGLAISKELTYPVDLSDDPTGVTRASDSIKIIGDLSVTAPLKLKANLLNGALGVGNYVIMTFTGAFSGSLSNITVSGITENKCTVVNTGNAIVLSIEASRDAAKVVWGGTNANWDLLTSKSWLMDGYEAMFTTGDTVVFNGIGKAKPSVTVVGTLSIGKMEVDASESNYAFTGTGSIIGDGDLVKTGTGKLTLSTTNTYTGKTIINGGTLEVKTLAMIANGSSIGAPAVKTASYLQLTDAKLRYAGTTQQTTDRGMTIVGNDTIEVVNSTGSIVTASPIVGAGKLVKTGAGKLIYNGANSYTGGTVIKAGNISLGSDAANFGTNSIAFEGGSLTMFNSGSSYTQNYWNFSVPEGYSGTVNADSRCDFWGSLTGGGTFNVYLTSLNSMGGVRETFGGNWSAFTGTINVTTSTYGGQFQINNSYGYAKAGLKLGAKVTAMHVTASTSVAVGEVTGVSTSTLSNTNWVIGGKNTDATFNGKIRGNLVTKVGTGTWTLTDTTFQTTVTTINGGKIQLLSPGYITGAVIVNNTGTLGGTGKVNSFVSVASGGSIEPGTAAIGTLKIGGSLTLATGSKTVIKVNRTANTQDTIRVTGKATLAGTLNMQLMAGTYAVGDAFKVINAASYAGNFTAVDPAVPGEGMSWDLSSMATDGTVRVVATTGIGTKTLDQLGINAYPNPTSANVTIELPDHGAMQIELYTIGGVKVKALEASGKTTLDVSDLAPGVYTLVVIGDNLKATKQIVKH